MDEKTLLVVSNRADGKEENCSFWETRLICQVGRVLTFLKMLHQQEILILVHVDRRSDYAVLISQIKAKSRHEIGQTDSASSKLNHCRQIFVGSLWKDL